jgi:hypothetical protein
MIYQLIVVSREQSGSGHLWWHAGATHLGNRARHVGKGQILILFGLLIVLGGCSGYGGETVGASGTRSGPLGTEMAFADYLYGRPQYPEWEEAKSSAIEQVTRRTPDVEITEDDDTLRVDYGPDGGLAVLQRFDRVGCQLTFSRVAGARAQEIEAWEQIIASLERTSPDPHYTPSP